MTSARVDGDRLEAVVRYGVDGVTWTQRFTARLLDERALGALLGGCRARLGRLARPAGLVPGAPSSGAAERPRGRSSRGRPVRREGATGQSAVGTPFAVVTAASAAAASL